MDTRGKQRREEILRQLENLNRELELINEKGYSVGFIFGFSDLNASSDFEKEVRKLVKEFDGEVIDLAYGIEEFGI